MARTKEDTINEVTCAYLAQLDIKNLPSPEDIKADILDQMKSAFDLENTVKEKAEKWRIMDRLIPVQVAAITATLYPVISLDMTNGAGKVRMQIPVRWLFTNTMEKMKAFMLLMKKILRTLEINTAME